MYGTQGLGPRTIGVETWLSNRIKYPNHVATIDALMTAWLRPTQMNAQIAENLSVPTMYVPLAATTAIAKSSHWSKRSN